MWLGQLAWLPNLCTMQSLVCAVAIGAFTKARRLVAKHERLVNCGQHLSNWQVVKTLTAALQMTFTTQFFAWKAGERVLHNPHIPSPLNFAGKRPRLG